MSGPALLHVAVLLEYDGTDFGGLQRQTNIRSIQGEVEAAAAAVGSPHCRFRASGRTDAGVHARGQVVTMMLPESLRRTSIVNALNWHLPGTIRARRAAEVPEAFDPRRDARRRTYSYLLCAGQPLPPLMRNRMGKCRSRLELELMHEAALILVGRHDFRAWRSTQCQARRTVLDLESVTIAPWSGAAAHGMDAQCFEMTFACRSFLHRMVRYLVGGLIQTGRGALKPVELAAHLEAGTLPPGVAPADACGLVLERVEYAAGKDPFAAPA